jgi:exodeoxyribonuclease VIII
MHYHVSAALTVEGIEAITGVTPRYIFLAIEPQPPYLIAAYEAKADDLKEGCEFVRLNLSTLKRCIDNGAWPGLPPEIRDLDVGRLGRRYQADPDDDELDEELEQQNSEIQEWWKCR